MKKYLWIIISIIVGIGILVYGAKLFSPGSYPFAERFDMSISETDLISLVKDFKIRNPEFRVPDGVSLVDGKNSPQDHWYRFYFYYSQQQQIIYTWVRSNGKGKATFAFVAVNDGLQLGREVYK